MLRGLLSDRDVLAGLFFVVFGSGATLYATRYPLGTLTNMGPGYFPAILGAVLVLFGAGTLLSAVFSTHHVKVPAVAIRPVVAIAASTFAFALLVEHIGLPLSVFVSSLLASAGRPHFLKPGNLLLAAILAALSVLVFIRLLGVPVPLVPPALQGF